MKVSLSLWLLPSLILGSALQYLEVNAVLERGTRVKLPAQGQQAESAEGRALFEKMETRLRNAKTFQVDFESAMTDTASAQKFRCGGRMAIQQANRVRLTLDRIRGAEDTENMSLVLVSNGSQMKVTRIDSRKGDLDDTKETPAFLADSLTVFLTRMSISWSAPLVPSLPEKLLGTKGSAEKQVALYDFQLKKPERIGDRSVQVLEYMQKSASFPTVKHKVWLDAESGLPVRHHCVMKNDLTEATFEESYKNWVIDAEIDPALFQWSR